MMMLRPSCTRCSQIPRSRPEDNNEAASALKWKSIYSLAQSSTAALPSTTIRMTGQLDEPKMSFAEKRRELLDSVPNCPPCDSLIWGHGDVLDRIQKAEMFHDSKIFVDLMLLHDEETVLNNFRKLKGYPHPTKEELNSFLLENFCQEEGLEFEDWDPIDMQEFPVYLRKLNQMQLIYVGLQVNKLWRMLSRKCSTLVRSNPDQCSLVYLPNGFVMPGGRFTEIYYWDTYWIVRGMLICHMFETVKGILENFIYQIKLHGHVPNGTRKYYLRRTQPPFLLSMFEKFIVATNDLDFLEGSMPYLEKEIAFFEEKRSKKYTWNGKEYTVFFYKADCRGPRPESYREDISIAEEKFQTDDEREEFYLHLKAAAESGWDFSSRWFIDENGGNSGTLADIKTCYILPVDLNALMTKNYSHLSSFNLRLNRKDAADRYKEKAESMRRTMEEVFWDSEEQMWFDIDSIHHKRRKYFYASNLSPLWAEAYPSKYKDARGLAAANYLTRTGAVSHEGGIPASLYHTEQQWDMNAWPPSQHLIVSGLNKTGNREAQKLAFQIAKTYVFTCTKSCKHEEGSFATFEKYDPMNPGNAGGGGEYKVQMGFGWTNGVLIDFIRTYGDDLIEQRDFHGMKYREPLGTERYSLGDVAQAVRAAIKLKGFPS